MEHLAPTHEGLVGLGTGCILLAEDDDMLAQFLMRLLRAQGYEVQHVATGSSVLQRLNKNVDLLLLDLNLPELDGLSILRQVRPLFPKIAILVLTALSRSDGLLPALNAGADDCLLKPFSYLELLARVRAHLRRNPPTAVEELVCGDLVLEPRHHRVKRGERRINLTQREFGLLEYLMRTPEVPISRAVLLKEVWGDNCEPTTNVVDVYMKYIRGKVDAPDLPKLVHTVRGIGYMVSG